MKLYLISQTVNRGYDTYDSAVVCAPNEQTAQLIHPQVLHWPTLPYDTYTWCSPDQVTAKYIGEAAEGTEQGVILASYNAG